MIRTQIQVTEEQMIALKKISAERNVSVAELIRNGIDHLIQTQNYVSLAERRKHAIALSGRFHAGDKDNNVSENHDDYLADIYAS